MYILCSGKTLPEVVGKAYKPIPELIIRETLSAKGSTFTFYFMKEKRAFTTKDTAVDNMEYFNPEKVWWFIEPGVTVQPLPKSEIIQLFATVSPLLIRYREICKDNADEVFMKTYTLNELLVIGKHMRPHLTSELQQIYTDEGIKVRYEKYGGIIRRVLPVDLRAIVKHSRELKLASRDEAKVQSLIDTLWWDSWNRWDSDSTSLESYVVHWDPKIKYTDVNEDEIVDIDFGYRTTKFASSHIYQKFGHVCRIVE